MPLDRVDVFPILRLLPDRFAPWRAKAQKLHLGSVKVLIQANGILDLGVFFSVNEADRFS